MTKLLIPKTHAQAIRQNLKTDPKVVSMVQNPYIYELGSCLSDICPDYELRNILYFTFSSRFSLVLDNAVNWRDEDPTEITNTMSESERKRKIFLFFILFLLLVFKKGYQCFVDYYNWLHHKNEGIKVATVISTLFKQNNKKRVQF